MKKCPICGREFGLQSQLERHIVTSPCMDRAFALIAKRPSRRADGRA